jgi:hypothetical protein
MCCACCLSNSPCTCFPCRILDDIGGAFGMGAVGGGAWHLFKGMRNSPSGARFRGGIEVSGQPVSKAMQQPSSSLFLWLWQL